MKKNALELLNLNKLRTLSSNIIEKSEKYYKSIFLDIFKQACNRPVRKDKSNLENNLLSSNELSRNSPKTIISKKSKSFLNTKPFDGNNVENLNLNLYTQEDMKRRDMETARYRLIRFLDNELKSEIEYHPNLISNEINNKILTDSFQYNEREGKLFLHKKTERYYVLINFSYLFPEKDEKYISQLLNEDMKNYKDNIQHKGMFQKALGLYDNAEIKEAKNEEDMIHIRDDNPDTRVVNFDINLINHKSEVMQYKCFFSSYQISIKTIRIFPSYKEFVEDMEKNGDVIEHNIPKNIKTKKPIIKKKAFNKDKYQGPDFYLLNRSLQNEFVRLLDDLNVKADIIKYMRYLGLNKERREYLAWFFKIMNHIKP